MNDERRYTNILLKILESNTKYWPKKPKFNVVCDSLLCAIVVDIGTEKRIQLSVFKRSELDDYLAGSHYLVENKIKTSLLLLQRKFFSNQSR